MIRSTPEHCEIFRTTRSRSRHNEVGGERVASPLLNKGCKDLEKVADTGGDSVSFLEIPAKSGDTLLNPPAAEEIGYGVAEISGILKIKQFLTQSIN
jgi:hypothetical protein